MRKREASPLGLYTIGIAALFLAGFFLLLVLGAQSYRDTVTGQDRNMETRALLAYFAASVKGSDMPGAVAVRETEEGPVLFIADGDTGYALRIYCRDGTLLEEYAQAEAPLAPETAQVIGKTETFSVEEGDGLWTVTTDAGRVRLHLRSEGGGGA